MLRKSILFASVVLMVWAAVAAAQTSVPVEFTGQVRVCNENEPW